MNACGEAWTGRTDNAKGEMVVTDTDNGKQLTLAVGQKLLVKLSAQLGTGYSWSLVGDAGPEFASIDAGESDGGKTVPGAAETQTFGFEARAAGTRELQFAYRRQWEKDAPAAKTFSIKATVTPS